MLTDEELRQKFLFLTSPQTGFRRMGIRDEVEEYRFKQTWHRLPLTRNWAATVGSWGCTRLNKEVMELAGVNAEAYKKFKVRHGVQAARTESQRVSSATRALTAAVKFENSDLGLEEKIHQISMDEQILPFELFLYIHEVDVLRKTLNRKYAVDLVRGHYNEIFSIEWIHRARAIDMMAARKYDAD